VTENSYDILIVDNDTVSAKKLETLCRDKGWKSLVVNRGDQALDCLDRFSFRVAVIELDTPGFSGLQILEWLKTQTKECEVILSTATGQVDSAVKAFKLGAFDYLTKPFEPLSHVATALQQALYKQQSLVSFKQYQTLSVDGEFESLVGRSSKMKGIFEMIRQVAPSPSNLLVLGESGTGKELVARAIHRHSKRSSQPFVVINSSAMPETLLESELFGYVKGAFTGAANDKQGLFEVADGGTIFLDEIGDIPISTQVKLLRVLQGGDFMSLGSSVSRKVDVRILAATNKNLTQAIAKGEFREDLYYRLNVINIMLPPLRERSEDIPLLAYHFLKKISKKVGKAVNKISVDFLQALQNYTWPGNVRELENVVERSIVLALGDTLNAKTLPPKVLSASFYSPSGKEEDLTQLAYKEAKKRALNIFNHSYIMNLLQKMQGNITAASEKAGMDRSNFKKIIRRYRLEGMSK